jgi:hypothetical protein
MNHQAIEQEFVLRMLYVCVLLQVMHVVVVTAPGQIAELE